MQDTPIMGGFELLLATWVVHTTTHPNEKLEGDGTTKERRKGG
jgi:hypothetical protein